MFVFFSEIPSSSMSNAVEFKSTETQVITAMGVFGDLHDSKVPKCFDFGIGKDSFQRKPIDSI